MKRQCLNLLSITVIDTMSNLGKKEFIFLAGYSLSPQEAKARTKAEAMEECCSLACFSWDFNLPPRALLASFSQATASGTGDKE